MEVEGNRNYETIKEAWKELHRKNPALRKTPQCRPLHITKVDVGETETLQNVCGAPNVAAGQSVLVARIGATLYPTKETLLPSKNRKSGKSCPKE